MPIKHRLHRTLPASAAELARLLTKEWTQPRQSGQPLIVLEGGNREPTHIFVIWDQWGELTQVERSEIIMDVVENLSGKHRIDGLVTVAMGLTSAEANRMGIEAA